MVVVVVAAVLAFVAGLAVLALLGLRVFRQVRVLGRTVAAGSERVAEAAAELERIAPRER
jgi:hypothetical protein